jgi:hypothetical protein
MTQINTSTKVLIALIAVDLVFVGLDLIYSHTDYLGQMYSLGRDRGYAEIYQYLKLAAICFLLGVMVWREPSLTYISWTLVFAYLLVDDAFLIHETYGLYAAERLPIPARFGLRGQDFGELLTTGISAAVLIFTVIIAYYLANPGQKAFTRRLLALIILLAFFGVMIDMIHELFRNTILYDPIGTIEDAGELIVVSVVAWFVFMTYSSGVA